MPYIFPIIAGLGPNPCRGWATFRQMRRACGYPLFDTPFSKNDSDELIWATTSVGVEPVFAAELQFEAYDVVLIPRRARTLTNY